jgi:hypothetical protein
MSHQELHMKQTAFLIDISSYKNSDGKYGFLGQILTLMVRGLMSQDPPKPASQLVSSLEGDSLIEIIEQFQKAFSDIEGLEMTGLARISSRVFLNLRGFEISVWTSNDDMYTIFVAVDPFQLATAVGQLTGFTDTDSAPFKTVLNNVLGTVHNLIFPPYSDISKGYGMS